VVTSLRGVHGNVRAAGYENYRLGECIAQQRKEPGAPLRGRGTPAYPARLRSERARNFLEKTQGTCEKTQVGKFQCRVPQKVGVRKFSGPLLENAHRESADGKTFRKSIGNFPEQRANQTSGPAGNGLLKNSARRRSDCKLFPQEALQRYCRMSSLPRRNS